MVLADWILKKREAKGEARGRAEGVAEGRAEGVAEGRAEGVAEGRAEGVAEGRAEGVAEGRAEGVDKALDKLRETAKRLNSVEQEDIDRIIEETRHSLKSDGSNS